MTIATESRHIKGLIGRSFFAATLMTTLCAGVLYIATTGVAAVTPSERYLDIESITVDPDTWCVTTIRNVKEEIPVKWSAELIDVDDPSIEDCGNGGFAPIQPKPDGRVVLPFATYFGGACSPDTGREWRVKVLYQFTKHGAQKTAGARSEPVRLKGKPAERCY